MRNTSGLRYLCCGAKVGTARMRNALCLWWCLCQTFSFSQDRSDVRLQPRVRQVPAIWHKKRQSTTGDQTVEKYRDLFFPSCACACAGFNTAYPARYRIRPVAANFGNTVSLRIIQHLTRMVYDSFHLLHLGSTCSTAHMYDAFFHLSRLFY